MGHLSTEQLQAGIDVVVASPGDSGTLEMIVCRPSVGERQVLDEGDLAVGTGLVGDNYVQRGNPRTEDGKADAQAQLNIMNSRAIDLVADGDKARWPLAGDQLFVDFDLSLGNAPAGTRLLIGSAVVEVSEKPHTGCAKFRARFGMDAARWVNSDKELRFRGINAMVVQAGTIRPGDAITKVSEQP